MIRKSILEEKSFGLALRIVKLHKYLQKNHKEYVLSKQILRSGTSIGALMSEAKYAQSTADYLNKQYIALKEANETKYWILLLRESEYLNKKMFDSIFPQIEEIIKMLVSSTKTIKEKISYLLLAHSTHLTLSGRTDMRPTPILSSHSMQMPNIGLSMRCKALFRRVSLTLASSRTLLLTCCSPIASSLVSLPSPQSGEIGFTFSSNSFICPVSEMMSFSIFSLICTFSCLVIGITLWYIRIIIH